MPNGRARSCWARLIAVKISTSVSLGFLLLIISCSSAVSRDNRTCSSEAAPSVVEATIPQMQEAMSAGVISSRDLVEQSLIRIATFEDRLNAVMYVNPRALEEADALDQERAEGRVRGPLHGIPIALKDNIQTTNMPTTGGALAFDGFVPPFEATLVKNLRDAGAVILAKTGMTELANWVAGSPTSMPGNYNAMHGYGMNPYDPRRDPRADTFDGRPALSVSGSSSGIGTSASFWFGNIGSETSGSILSPSNQNMLAAIKPTIGRVSRWGIIPITADQDTAGPMARTVTDAAILLGALEGASPDPHDSATTRCARPARNDYRPFLDKNGLAGARIGIPRAYYFDEITPPGSEDARGGLDDAERALMSDAIEVLRRKGAVIVDPANIPSIIATAENDNILRWGVCAGADDAKGSNEDCSIVFAYGMKRDFNAWLDSLGDAAPLESLTALREWNLAHQKAGAIKYGQSRLDISDEIDLVADRERYEQDRAKDLRLSAAEGIDAVMKRHRLDAILFPASWGASIAAKPGYPTVMVPFGMVPNAPGTPFPDGFDARPSPMGVSFTGLACSEPSLLRIAYAFEQATKKRVPPPLE